MQSRIRKQNDIIYLSKSYNDRSSRLITALTGLQNV